MPWSVGCPFTWRKSPTIMEMSYSFAQCYNGYVDIGFLGFAQVDMYGNVNTHIIGEDFHKPKVRLTGSGGNNDLSSLTENMVLVGLQSRINFWRRLIHHFSGTSDRRHSREEAGLLGNGPVAVISPWGVYDFEPVSKRMRIKSLTPGVTFDIAQSLTGFELLKSEGDIPQTKLITDDALKIMRAEVDPRGVFTTMPTA